MSDKKREQQYLGLVAGLTTPAPTPEREQKPKREPAPKAKHQPDSWEMPETTEAEEKEKEKVVKLTAYIPKSLHKRIKITMLEKDAEYTFSDLIVNLLRDWEKEQGAQV